MTAARTRQPVRRVRPFTPAQEAAALLSERTVGRDAVLTTLDQRLLDAATSGSRAHTLLIGPRGAGKTHLMRVAIHRAQQRPEVAKRLAFVRFDEDAVGLSRYTDLLAEALVQLSPATAGGRRFTHSDRPEGAVADALGDRVLVLVIENLDRIFNALGKSGQQDLRAWVETSGQVMVLATAPLLFKGVNDRAMPWWGNFGIVQLGELDLAQGQELLIRLANESGDTGLAEFLVTSKGESRLKALNALAGGSPRIWMILSECLTVELLDELVPAVEALLEGLVPYYQQLLWDLTPVEQRLVRVLADGPRQASTVSELAEAAGIQPRVAATTLGRLVDIRWVRAEKAPELDQRSTWYRLQEPMVRHHFHYRAATDQPLPLIVEILKAWFDPADRRAHLAHVEPASQAERFLAAALGSERFSSNDAYNDHDVDQLLAEARRWAAGADSESRTTDAGVLIDLAVCRVRQGPTAVGKLLEHRTLGTQNLPAAIAMTEAAEPDTSTTESARVGQLLKLGSSRSFGRTHSVMEFISACWDGQSDPAIAVSRLAALVASVGEDALGINIRNELGYWLGMAGEVVAARDLFLELVPLCVRVLGAEHRDSLVARSNLAYWSGEAGDVAAARDQYAELVPLHIQALGAEHRDTLIARSNLAYWSGEAGDVAAARDQYAELVPLFERVLGAEHRDTLVDRLNLAAWTGVAGDVMAARDLFLELVPLCVRVLGAEHRDTLIARSNLAYWSGEGGDVVAARDQYAELVPLFERVLGAEHRHTLVALLNLACVSDPAASVDIAARLLLVTRKTALDRNLADRALFLIVNGLRGTTGERASRDGSIDVTELGLGGLLQGAAAGSAEALIRLPSELVPIVEELRAQRSASANA